ncbi:hypothetical protein [Lichenifustis flavocetrariae]|uniref:Uncharacterized protein n=1 Tax=Lichenifustis flavocetrariae TaxID=2949735 RepID=A0AA41Z867_9HYPH|nr:hypothetical protein [Lichenifustis flavocetrariae]MCW6512115.1 hypothetical protein [Lichenifustis flavocetrariae]
MPDQSPRWVDGPRYTTVPFTFSVIQAAIECQEARLTLGDLHDAARPGSWSPRLRCWRMGEPAVPHTTRSEVADWLLRRAEHRIAERARWTFQHSGEADRDIMRMVA